MTINGGDDFNPDELYEQFPPGAAAGFGPEQGYNRFVRLNDPELFTEAARNDPVIREFLDAPFSVTYVQFKSSHREAEYYIHKPHRVMGGDVSGDEGAVAGFSADEPHIGTYVINHDRTLARAIMYAMVLSDGTQTGQIVYKQHGS